MPERRIPSITELYEKILKRSPLPLPGFEAKVTAKAVKRAGGIHDYPKFRAYRGAIAAQRMYMIGYEASTLGQHLDIYCAMDR
jgi:hypothetical protein